MGVAGASDWREGRIIPLVGAALQRGSMLQKDDALKRVATAARAVLASHVRRATGNAFVCARRV